MNPKNFKGQLSAIFNSGQGAKTAPISEQLELLILRGRFLLTGGCVGLTVVAVILAVSYLWSPWAPGEPVKIYYPAPLQALLNIELAQGALKPTQYLIRQAEKGSADDVRAILSEKKLMTQGY